MSMELKQRLNVTYLYLSDKRVKEDLIVKTYFFKFVAWLMHRKMLKGQLKEKVGNYKVIYNNSLSLYTFLHLHSYIWQMLVSKATSFKVFACLNMHH